MQLCQTQEPQLWTSQDWGQGPMTQPQDPGRPSQAQADPLSREGQELAQELLRPPRASASQQGKCLRRGDPRASGVAYPGQATGSVLLGLTVQLAQDWAAW